MNRQIFKRDANVSPEVMEVMLPTVHQVPVYFELEDKSMLKTASHGFINKFPDGKITPIRVVKSDRYSELDHTHTFNTVVSELKNLNEGLRMQSFSMNHDASLVRSSIVLDKAFNLDEVPVEFNMKNVPSYARNPFNDSNDGFSKGGDIFYPMISITNSFHGSSQVSFNLFRRICENGLMFGEVLNEKIAFRHFGDIQNEFNEKVQQFIMKIFEKRFIEKIFEKYNSVNMSKDEVQTFSEKNLGKRVAKEIGAGDGEFGTLQRQMTAWAFLQILTRYTTHNVKNYNVAQSALKNLNNWVETQK